ncbi:hypothetical protein M6B38_136670 [Iris pallida]|uniref:Uncharacterized protein n=1 Tax=Iris pallida TaxID=29817 RepID=A0AAX6FF37_IRIPA|nr:hypothetical protein M6B38_136670 [Iris pallida]
MSCSMQHCFFGLSVLPSRGLWNLPSFSNLGLVWFTESPGWERKVINFLCLGAKGIDEERKVIPNGREIRGESDSIPTLK